jgi:hypothetical protein
VQRSRDVFAAHLDAFAHGMFSLYYFNQINTSGPMEAPFLRAPTDMGGDQTSGFLYMQWVQRLITSPAAEPATPHVARARWGAYGCSYHPLLITAAYANLVRNFESAEFRAAFQPGPNGTGYAFERDGRTICAMWLRKPVPAETFVLRGETPFAVEDLFGRTQRITPVQGVSLVSLDENPAVLVFDKRFEDLPAAIERVPAPGGLSLAPVARGGTGSARVTVPGIFGTALELSVSGETDARWPDIPDRTVRVAPHEPTAVELPFRLSEERDVGAYPFFARLRHGDGVCGLLRGRLEVAELLRLTLTGVPATSASDPAIELVVESLHERPSEGTARLTAGPLSAGTRPTPAERAYAIDPGGRTVLRFPLDQEIVNLTASYEVTAEVADESGLDLARTESIAFRATPKAPPGIVIDGRLDDWQEAGRMPMPFSREFTSWGKPRRGDADLSGVYYTAWDEKHLYFAVSVTDDSNVVRFDDISIWQDDNIMLGLYPWGWQRGEPLNSGYYREHLGMCRDGVARIFRVGNAAAGPATAGGAAVAVRREGNRTLYEWRYPAAAVAPLALEPGGRFRLSLFVLDRDMTGEGDGEPAYTKLGGIQLGGFNENVDARPVKWMEFVLAP